MFYVVCLTYDKACEVARELQLDGWQTEICSLKCVRYWRLKNSPKIKVSR